MRKRSLRLPRLPRLPQMVSHFVIFIFFRCLARYSKIFIFVLFFFFFDEKKTRLHLNQVHCCHPRSQKIFSLVSNVKDVASYLLS